jgi:hypothetical protein
MCARLVMNPYSHKASWADEGSESCFIHPLNTYLVWCCHLNQQRGSPHFAASAAVAWLWVPSASTQAAAALRQLHGVIKYLYGKMSTLLASSFQKQRS